MIRSGMKWMFLIVGTMIGAGYASGRELWQFFGHDSGLAILLFTILFSICCYVILSISYEKQSQHYLPVLRTIVGKHLTLLYDGMILLYLFTTTVIMLAGSGATWQAFHFSYWVGILAIAIPLVLVFVWDIKGILSMNSFILPLLIGGLLYVLILFTVQQELSIFAHLGEQKNWTAAFPFTALNILPLIAVLGAVGNQMKVKGEIWIASIGSGMILGTISFIYNNSLIQISEDILLYEIPLFAILKHYPYEMFLFISVLLWIAIFTTAASGMLGLITRFRKRFTGPMWLLALLTLMLMAPLTSFGFSTLIKYLYPLYGLLNLYVLSSLLLYPLTNRYKSQ
ncbi:YkvI family membrane protein [Pontibacillus marinus]|uniref:Membrane protein n=1 Tax=Pontibacillus marinus BH030004 = DSM 16465 TaxID=1385511 RepID=A0A0A5GB25_9BACI|nr:membrane protein [Pontibacillus marinus]KGX89239.1 membrane protein [Pontibacillus marinus BH030004 = DSM 16465]